MTGAPTGGPTDGPTVPADHVVALDGRAELTVELVGGKAFGLNRMQALGLPSPRAFVITTAAFPASHDQTPLPEPVWSAVLDHLAALERRTGRTFGGSPPLLVSVRSGAAVSLPGMMDTVLNLGDAPGDPLAHLRAAISAVQASWWSERAQAYRDRYGIPHDAGTAVVIQAMVFGDRDDRSGTGVVFSRHPGTGEPMWHGEWIAGAQGDELVAGLRTPEPIDALAEAEPELASELAAAVAVLERDAHDVVEVEFTIESGRLFLLQTRTAKRSPRAAVRTSVELCRSGLIDRRTAVARVSAHQADVLARERALVAGGAELTRGVPAGPGTAAGRAIVDIDDALAAAADGDAVVLVRPHTSPRDVVAMLEAVAVVTARGGATSHAALVCREAGLPAVVGCGDEVLERLDGRLVTVDGTAGRVYDGDRTRTVGTDDTGDDMGEPGGAGGTGDGDGDPSGREIDRFVDTLVRWAIEELGGNELPPDHPLAVLS